MRLLAASLILTAFASAQTCSNLAVTPGQRNLTISLTNGAPAAIAVVALGSTAGSTSIPLGPAGSLDLGLAMPFAPLPLGMTNANGDASIVLRIPNTLPGQDLVAQGFTAAISMGIPNPTSPTPPSISIAFCTSNVVSFHVGN